MALTAEQQQENLRYLYPAEVPSLKALALSLPANPIVANVGAGFGTSGLAFLESRPDLTLYTVDVENGPSPTGSLETERSVIRAAGLEHLFGSRWHQTWGDSVAVGKAWPFPVHMVFIDADHSYEGAFADIETWTKNLLPGGIIAVHDYGKNDVPFNPHGPTPDPFPGVDRAVDELLLHRHGIVLHLESLIAFRIIDPATAHNMQG